VSKREFRLALGQIEFKMVLVYSRDQLLPCRGAEADSSVLLVQETSSKSYQQKPSYGLADNPPPFESESN
jgi:hypothetical protein